ncbi:MAG: 4Fe-4S binding protein [Gloeomargarita sp. GMQP_bins_69]
MVVSRRKRRYGKPSQWGMVWLFFLIAVGGLFQPLLGYLMLAMMLFIPFEAYFHGRYWCGNLCPRGAFLDIFLARVSPRRPYPRLFRSKLLRWGIFVLVMSGFVVRLSYAWGDWLAVGGVFVSMCVVTSTVAIALGLTYNERAWCAICPMGTLQESIAKLGPATRKQRQPAKSTQALPAAGEVEET